MRQCDPKRQYVARVGRQYVAAHLFPKNKTALCLSSRRLVVPRRLVVSLQRDDVVGRSGDGARTRDSLLGRQSVTKSALACYELA